MERRYITMQELRVNEEGMKPLIQGHAALFDSLSVDLGGFREKIRAGAFSKTIQEADIRALYNHDPNFVLGRNKSGTLSLFEDERGLRVTIDPPNTTYAQDLIKSMKRGDVDQMSFGFDTIRDEWTQDANGANVRELIEVRLFDVSPVTFPAYTETSVQVRSAYYRHLEERGENLAAWLNRKIDEVASEQGVERSDVITQIADATNRAPDTINNILSANINCPPLEVLEGFGMVLDAPTSELVALAERDGCQYETNERNAPIKADHPLLENDVPEQKRQVYIALMRQKLKILELS